MNAYADEVLSVTATIPAPIPAGTPTIDAPADGSVTTSDTVTVSGTCPVISPAIIIAIYRNLLLAGSTQCDGGGEYSVPISLEPGENALVATVVTITNGVGNSSDEAVVVYDAPEPPVPPADPESPVAPGQEAVEGFELLAPPLQVLAKDIYVLAGANGSATWRGSFSGGTGPYVVSFDWGDGVVDRREVADSSEQTFTHTYKNIQTRALVITVTDANGESATLRSTVIAPEAKAVGLVIDKKAGASGIPPIIEFVQEHAATIYISAVSALAFLWYLESGRHILSIGEMMAHLFHHPHGKS